MIHACIFDTGTIVDKYSGAVFFSLKRAFLRNNIRLTDKETFETEKSIDHQIKDIMSGVHFQKKWFNEYKRFPEYRDVDVVYEDFKTEYNIASKTVTVLDETQACFEYLKDKGIKVCVTSSYDKLNLDIILSGLDRGGLHVDAATYSIGSNGSTRDMVSILQSSLGLENHQIIKFDDTPWAIGAAKECGYLSVGVSRWSSLMRMTEPEDIQGCGLMTSHEYKIKCRLTRDRLIDAGADYVINDLSEIDDLFDELTGGYSKGVIPYRQ